MNTRSAIYYPFLEVKDESWLKLAALFWDHLLRITPHTGFQMASPSDTQRELQESTDFFRDLELIERHMFGFHSCRMLALLTRHAQQNSDSPFAYLLEPISQGFQPYFTWGSLEQLKGPGFWLSELENQGLTRNEGGHCCFDERSGATYMALLAGEFARERGIGIVTDDYTHARILELIGYFEPMQTELYIDYLCSQPTDLERAHFEQSRPVQRDKLSVSDPSIPFGLAQFAYKSFGLPDLDNVPVSSLVKFREKYGAERRRYFSEVSRLASLLEGCSTTDELNERLSAVSADIEDALADLRSALRGLKIDTTISWSSLSLSVPLAEALALAVPVAKPLLIGTAAAAGAVAAIRRGQKARREVAKASPWIYLSMAGRSLKPEDHFERW